MTAEGKGERFAFLTEASSEGDTSAMEELCHAFCAEQIDGKTVLYNQ